MTRLKCGRVLILSIGAWFMADSIVSASRIWIEDSFNDFADGQLNTAVNQADALFTPNIHCDLWVWEPYRSCMQEDLDWARSWAEQNFSELLKR